MEKDDFFYKKKPAFLSFLITYFICFGISFWLIDNSPLISKEISKTVMPHLGIPRSDFLYNLPYGIIFSVPFLIYGIRTLLWNLMNTYEVTSHEIRLITGRLTRNEKVFPVFDIYEISFKQNLIEAPFRIGSLVLKTKDSGQLVIKGIRYMVDRLRKQTGSIYR